MTLNPMTLPNLFTALRIASAPMLALAVFSENVDQPKWVAAAILLFGTLTDLVDGPLARSTNQVSELGVILDPIADKILIVTALFLLCADGRLQGASLWPVLIIFWRELLISGLREYDKRFRVLVSVPAKWKTAMQFSAAIFLFAARVPSHMSDALFAGGTVLLWVAAALTLYTGLAYIGQVWRQSWK